MGDLRQRLHFAGYKRRLFIEEPKKAEITICGLGFFRLWINGREVSEDKFVPVNSQYCKRDLTAFEYPILDELSYRTYAVRYDISKFVIDGKNDIRVILGCGWFAQQKRSAEGFAKYGDIKLYYKINAENKSGENILLFPMRTLNGSRAALLKIIYISARFTT